MWKAQVHSKNSNIVANIRLWRIGGKRNKGSCCYLLMVRCCYYYYRLIKSFLCCRELASIYWVRTTTIYNLPKNIPPVYHHVNGTPELMLLVLTTLSCLGWGTHANLDWVQYICGFINMFITSLLGGVGDPTHVRRCGRIGPMCSYCDGWTER